MSNVKPIIPSEIKKKEIVVPDYVMEAINSLISEYYVQGKPLFLSVSVIMNAINLRYYDDQRAPKNVDNNPYVPLAIRKYEEAGWDVESVNYPYCNDLEYYQFTWKGE